MAATPTSNCLFATAASSPEKSWPVNSTFLMPARFATSLNSSTSNPVKLPEESVNVYGFRSPTLATLTWPGVMRPRGLSLLVELLPESLDPQPASTRAAIAVAAERRAARRPVLVLITSFQSVRGGWLRVASGAGREPSWEQEDRPL